MPSLARSLWLRARIAETLLRQRAARARFRAQGVNTEASAQAVLDGFTTETEQEIADRRALDSTPVNRIKDQLVESRRRNLLEACCPTNCTASILFQKGLRTALLLEI
jgi:hypothetical protein